MYSPKVNNEIVVLVFVLLLACSCICGASVINTATASKTWTVDNDGSADYRTIQEAIDNANDRDTILVFSGTYLEHLLVDKVLSIIGEDQNSVIIDGNDAGTVVKVTSNNVTIIGFTIQNGNEGVTLLSNNNNITDNLISGNEVGVLLDSDCTENTISHNEILFSNTDGIYGDRSGSNVVSNNIISLNSWHGIFLYASEPSIIDSNMIMSNGLDGMYIRYSSNNTITGNLVSHNNVNGVYIYSDNDPLRPSGLSKDNKIGNNTIQNNLCGIKVMHFGTDFESAKNEICGNYIAYNDNGLSISGSSGNSICHNNFIANSNAVSIYETFDNTWDSGYPGGGNYWSDHNSTDLYWGPYQNMTGSDGIGDIPYPVSVNPTHDKYPYVHENGWQMFPEISIFSPSNSTFRLNTLPLSFTTNKPVSISYSLDDQPNITIVENLVLMDLPIGVHSITVYANDTFGNKVASKIWFTITFLGDLSLDGTVNIIDVSIVAYSFGHIFGSERWNPDADLNNDYVINIVDVAMVAKEFGKAI